MGKMQDQEKVFYFRINTGLYPAQMADMVYLSQM